MSSDAYHMTSPPENGAGAALAMVNAIRDAGINRPDWLRQRARYLYAGRR
jgi:3-oxoacyl-(acyl-carrier-protein) synthase